jgi:hypothetical protein
MTTLLAIHSYPGGNDAFARHWPFFQNQKADTIFGIGTTDGQCTWPPDINGTLNIGKNSYIDGPHLPNRMIDTVEQMLALEWQVMILCEYDTLFLNRIKVEKMTEPLASHYAGGPTWGSKASCFYHAPWIWKRDAASEFIVVGTEAIRDGICPDRQRGQPPSAECSPDVFFAYVSEKMPGGSVQKNLWTEYSRNDLKDTGRLEGARKAYREGIDIIHGVKTKEELDYIVS